MITEQGKILFGESSTEAVSKMHSDLREAREKDGEGLTLIVETNNRQIVCVDALIPIECWVDELTERLRCPN